MQAVVTAVTHRGLVREENEDSITVGPLVSSANMCRPITLRLAVDAENPLVCAVADGLGGHAGGASASRHIAHALASITSPLVTVQAMRDHLQRLSDDLYHRMEESPSLRGMGTTVAGFVTDGANVVVFNVGDSRVYREQDGYLGQVSIDDRPGGDVWAAQDEHAGTASGVVTQSLGGAGHRLQIDPHVIAMNLERENAGRFLVCSDGLSGVVPTEELEACMAEDRDAAAAKTMWSEAMRAGGPDNVSILLVRFDDLDF